MTTDQPADHAADPAVGAGIDGSHLDAADEAQLQEVRQRLLRDAAVAGVDATTVEASISEAIVSYADAPVRAFIGVLVERDVRAELSLPASNDQDRPA